jgi:hypothetical protein
MAVLSSTKARQRSRGKYNAGEDVRLLGHGSYRAPSGLCGERASVALPLHARHEDLVGMAGFEPTTP